MAKAIEALESGLKIGHAALGARGDVPGSVRQQTYDGDTIIVDPDGNLGLRFLGVDAPEVSFPLPGNSTAFVSISDPRWATFLDDPFDLAFGAIDPPLDPALRASLAARVGRGAAANHAELAETAERALEVQIESDIAALQQTPETFRFFCAFAHEVMDGYGRLLCYINRDQPDADDPKSRPRSYNERLLAVGHVSPYFIWPNVDPYRRSSGSSMPCRSRARSHLPASRPKTATRSMRHANRCGRPGSRGSASSQPGTRFASIPSSSASSPAGGRRIGG
jgi:endonuclease YncB( thermonuclease family)